MSIILKLKEHLIGEGLELLPPVKNQDIEIFEEHYGVVLPEDLKQYFLTFNGTGELNFGDSGYSFFSLHQLRPITKEMDLKDEEASIYNSCFVFSDYMLWCWAYVIRLSTSNENCPVLSYGLSSPSDLKVASSFSDFISIYLEYPDDVIGST